MTIQRRKRRPSQHPKSVMQLHSRTERKSSGSTKRCANAYLAARPLRLPGPRRQEVRPRLDRILVRVEVEERDEVEAEIIGKRENLRPLRASLSIFTTRLLQQSQMHPLGGVAVPSLNVLAPTLKLHSNHYATRGALMLVGEGASISTGVLEQAKTCDAAISFPTAQSRYPREFKEDLVLH